MVISTNSLPCGYVIRVKQISHRTVHDDIVRMNKNRMDKYTNANYYLSPLNSRLTMTLLINLIDGSHLFTCLLD